MSEEKSEAKAEAVNPSELSEKELEQVAGGFAGGIAQVGLGIAGIGPSPGGKNFTAPISEDDR